ncbi:MAG: nucleotidyltransferase domain-containing protein [Candidatus Binatia bacterium]
MDNRVEKSHRLFEVAESQQGYFTSADAKSLGYDYPHQHFHVKHGNWIRVDHGIYRLKKFPAAAHEDLMRWWLWSRKKAVISHESAAALYELGDLLPSKIHLTVPPNFRKSPAKGVILHKAELSDSEVEKRDDLPVTTPLRIVLDLARSHLDDERLTTVAKDSIRKGLLSRKELLQELAKIEEGIDPIAQTTLRLAARVEGESQYVDRSTLDDSPRVRETSILTIQPELAIEDLLSELKTGLRLVYGKQLKGIFLFGSYARGEADRESDFDVLVVLQDFKRYALEVDRTAELTADLSLKHGVTISPVFFREDEWLHDTTPFLSNVRDEAVPA